MRLASADSPTDKSSPEPSKGRSDGVSASGHKGLARFKERLQQREEISPRQPAWWVAFGLLVMDRLRNLQLAQVAASLTFTTTLSLVPMVTVALAIFTAFPMFEELQGRVENYMFEGFLPPNLSATILDYINQFSQKAKGLTAIGTVFLVVTSLATMLTVDRVFNQIWHVKRQRGLINKLILYWSVISLAPLLVGLSLSVTTALIQVSLTSTGGGDLPEFLPLLSLLPVAITALAFSMIYLLVPNRAVRWSDALVGGAVSALLFEASKRLFAIYVTHFPSYTAVYGTLAAFPIFLIWIYVSWIIVLLGAAIVAALPVARTGVWDSQEKAGQKWIHGLRVLKELDQSRYTDRPGLTMEELRVLTRISPDQLDDILTLLIDNGTVGLLSGSKSRERYVLVCNPEAVPAESVAKILWFNPEVCTNLDEYLPNSSAKLAEFRHRYLSDRSLADWLCDPTIEK